MNSTTHPAVQYLTALFQPDDIVCLTFIHGTKTYADGGAVTENIFIPLSKVVTDAGIKRLTKRNAREHVFVSMAPFKPGSKNRTKANIAQVRHLFMDADERGEEVLAAVKAAVRANQIPEPTVIVRSSPGKYQFVWNVEGFDIALQEAMNRTLQQKFGTDVQAVDAARVLRIPGFKNIKPKYDPHPTAEIVEHNPSIYTFSPDDFDISLAVEPDRAEYPVASDETVRQNIDFLEAAMDAADVGHSRVKVWEGSGGAYKFDLSECPWRENHSDGRASDAIAIVQPSGAYAFKCLHAHCADKGWTEFRAYLEERAGRLLPFVAKPPAPKSLGAAAALEFTESGTSPGPSFVSLGQAPRELIFSKPAVAGGDYDFVVNPAPGERDGWFPLGSPSLVGGSSGTNKSTLMLQLLYAQKRGEDFLGHTTNGRPHLTIMADRGESSHRRTVDRVGLTEADIPTKFLGVSTGLAALQEIVNRIEESDPLPQIVFIEGVDVLVEDANKKQFVAPFLSGLQKIAHHYHLAIVGSTGAPKAKVGEGYIAKRDNISGTEAWARLSETVMLLQYPQGMDTKSERELSVLLRNAPPESFAMVLRNGRVELQTEDDRKRAQARNPEIAWVQEQAALGRQDESKRWWTSLDMERGVGVSQPTAYRWLKDAVARHYIIEKPGQRGRGRAAQYQWNEARTNPIWIEETAEEPTQMEWAA